MLQIPADESSIQNTFKSRFLNISKFIPGTIWITGITASGKTTLGQRLYDNLVELGIENIEFYDGDLLRKRLDRTYGHSMEERKKVFAKMLEIIKESDVQGNVAIVSTVSHKKYMREVARNSLQNFMEVYLKCPANVCSQRDVKGHYVKAINGEYELFPGITESYEESINTPELVLDTSLLSIEECSARLLTQTLKSFGTTPKN